MDGDLIETIAEATRIPRGPLAAIKLKADNLIHTARAKIIRWWDKQYIPTYLGALGHLIEGNRHCHMAVLSRDPPVLLVPIGGVRPLWMVEALSHGLRKRPALFLLLVYWSLEYTKGMRLLRMNVESHQRRFPGHKLVFFCNTAQELKLLEETGIEAILLNHNQIVPETVFQQCDDESVAFDAVYNAKTARFKRHYLASAIDRVLYVAYRSSDDMSASAERAYLQRIMARCPAHEFANPVVDGLPLRLAPSDVNRAYNRAAVGLCLSPVEGAMYSSVEYLLAGLPVVTTPSRGGRDYFLDPEFCITAPPDTRSIRDAVLALRERKIPRSTVRNRTLAHIHAERERGRRQIEAVLAKSGIDPEMAAFWPPENGHSAIGFQSIRSHLSGWTASRP